MLILPPENPVNYDLCNQTVTVYHCNRDSKTVTRTVYRKAFLDFKKTQNVDKTGSTEVNSFLLVIPGDRQTVFVGDKVLMGIGGPVSFADWSKLVPSTTPGLCIVKSADPKYWANKIVHTEAGG